MNKSKYFVVGTEDEAKLIKEVTGEEYYMYQDGHCTFIRKKSIELAWIFIKKYKINKN